MVSSEKRKLDEDGDGSGSKATKTSSDGAEITSAKDAAGKQSYKISHSDGTVVSCVGCATMGSLAEHLARAARAAADASTAAPATAKSTKVEQAPSAKLSDEVTSVIHSKYVLPVSEPGPDDPLVCLADHAVAISENGRIAEILPSAAAHEKFTSAEHTELPEHVLMPGLVNAHTHAPMSLLRGYADDLGLIEWLTTKIFPAEGRWVNSEFVRDGTLVSIAEMIRCGTTCYNDMYFFPEVSGEVVAETGMRAALGMIVMMFPTSYVQGDVGTQVADEYMKKGRVVAKAMKQLCPDRIKMFWAPHAPYTVMDATWEKIRDASIEMDTQIHTHVHETQEECDNSEQLNTEAMSCHKSDHKCRPLANLQRMGLLTPRLVAAHMVCLTDAECESVGKAGCSTVHCPTSNLKLACGTSPVSLLLSQGANVALGTDGTCSNNTLDMFAEMKLAALVAKGAAQPKNAAAVNAATAIRLATINGARALTMDDVTGSLVPGKFADMIAVRLDSVECMPLYSVPSHLVYTCGREHVTDVWVAGRCLMRHRTLLSIDETSLKCKTRDWQTKIAAWAAEQKK